MPDKISSPKSNIPWNDQFKSVRNYACDKKNYLNKSSLLISKSPNQYLHCFMKHVCNGRWFSAQLSSWTVNYYLPHSVKEFLDFYCLLFVCFGLTHCA